MPEVIAKALAAEKLNMSVRRLMERSAEGWINRVKARDPETGRPGVMFRVADVERLAKALAQVTNVPPRKPIDVKFEKPAAPPPKEPLLLGAPAGSGKTELLARNWLTLADASEYSGVPARILKGLVRSGKLLAMPIGFHRVLVRKADVDSIEPENCAAMFADTQK
jgi:hypothetical protein